MGRLPSLLACLLTLSGAPATVLYQDDFDTQPLTWQSYRPDAQVVAETDTAKSGAALETTYELVLQKQIHAVGTSLNATLAGARRVCLSLRSSRQGLFIVALSENDGSRYDTLVNNPGGKWLDLQLSLDRFKLADDSDDENDQLDADQVNSLGVGDLSAMLTAMLSIGDKPEPGDRTFWLDDVVIDTDEALTAYSFNGALPFILDDFNAGFLSWIPAHGDVSLDEAGHQLVWTYTGVKPASGFPAIVSPLGRLPREGATHLLLTLQSERAMKLLVVLQEARREKRKQDESNYFTVVDIPGGNQVGTYALKLSDLTLSTDDGGSDENDKLDLDQVGALILADLEVMMGTGAPNTLRLDSVELAGQ